MYNYPAPHPDQKYINALLNHDPILLDELHEKFVPVIKYMVLQNNGTISDAADIFKEVLIDIYHKAKTGNFILASEFSDFLYMVCRKKWLDKLDKDKKGFKEIHVDINEYSGLNSFEMAEHSALKQQRLELRGKKFAESGESSRNTSQLHPDQKYITALLTNDPTLLNDLYKNFAPLIQRMILRNNGTISDAADVFQDALVAIYHKAKAGNLVLTCKFDCYLYQICKNQWLTKISKNIRENKILKEISLCNERYVENPVEKLEKVAQQKQRSDLFEEVRRTWKGLPGIAAFKMEWRINEEGGADLKQNLCFCQDKKIKDRETANNIYKAISKVCPFAKMIFMIVPFLIYIKSKFHQGIFIRNNPANLLSDVLPSASIPLGNVYNADVCGR